MSGTLMKSISGIRGIVGDSMTPELIVEVARGFAKYTGKGTIVVGRDSRPTGKVIGDMLSSVLAMAGCDVVDIGIVPTPTVQLMVEELEAAGGVVISASHNPIEWNAFKLINSNGTFLNAKEISRFFSFMDKAGKYEKWSGVGAITEDTTASAMHISRVLKIVNAAKIKKSKFKVVLDSVNGAGSIITRELLKKLGCRVIPLYCEIDGTFPRGSEPVPANLSDLASAVKKHKADIGFAQDPDADRLAIVNEKGEPIGEELTISLVADHLLETEVGQVIVNLSTTRTVEDVAARYGAPFRRSRVGEINVVDEMRKKGARIGGEGNGGVISPEVHLGRDSLVGIGYILDMMAKRKKTVSEMVSELPHYKMIKGKVKVSGKTMDAGILDKIKNDFKTEKCDNRDGLRIDFKKHESFSGGWVHLRSSNTEPIFRIISEGSDEKQAKKIYNYFAACFK